MSKVKICGLKRPQDIESVNKFLPDYIGFVFAPSKRQVSLEIAQQLKALLHPSIKTVGVFVNESIEKIVQYEQLGIINIVQLHGDENLVYIKELKKSSSLPIIKAFRIKDEKSLENQCNLIENSILDSVLLDAFSPVKYGGLGESFDWNLLEKIQRPYFLAGGIGIDNIDEALAHKPYAVDVSSKVETDGMKDERKVRELIEKIRQFDK